MIVATWKTLGFEGGLIIYKSKYFIELEVIAEPGCAQQLAEGNHAASDFGVASNHWDALI